MNGTSAREKREDVVFAHERRVSVVFAIRWASWRYKVRAPVLECRASDLHSQPDKTAIRRT